MFNKGVIVMTKAVINLKEKIIEIYYWCNNQWYLRYSFEISNEMEVK